MKYLLILLSLSVFSSCKKEVIKASNLNNGNGIWLVEDITSVTYDSLGNETGSIQIKAPGEMIFFKSHHGSLALHLATFIEYTANGSPGESYNFRYSTTGNRIILQEVSSGAPISLFGHFNHVKNGKRNQEWVAITTYANKDFDNRIATKLTYRLKK